MGRGGLHRIERRRRRRGLTINQFAAVVISASVLLLAVGIVLKLEPDEAPAIADAELEQSFAPAAGGNAADEDKGGFSLRRAMRERTK